MIDIESVVGTGTNMIMCWRFEDAPILFQELSTHGGDEELVFLVPAEAGEMFDATTPLFDILYSGYIKPARINLGTHIVYITAH